MKYSQFLELSELLKVHNVKLENFLNEADEPAEEDKLDTQKSGFTETVFSNKKRRLRKSLDRHAKKLQDGINKNITEKFINPLVDQKVKIYQKMAEVGKGKQPKDIVAGLKIDLQNMKKIEDKQIALIEKTAETIISNYTKKIESTLQKKNFKERTIADLQSYWSLLAAQVMNNLFKKLIKLDDQAIEKTIQDKGILNAAKIINKAINRNMTVKLIERDKKIKELQKQIKDKDEKEKTETPAEGEKPAEEEKPTEIK